MQKNKKFFSISQTAKIANVTTETLRHYDRIDLVKPCKVDEWTGYRYYSEQEIVRLNTIRTLRCMDMPLSEIKKILSYDDFGKIIESLKQAEESADEKIAELNLAKEKIKRARLYYESKLEGQTAARSPFVKILPQRVILLSQSMDTPTVDNLWNYHRHFYAQLPEDMRGDFSFEDLAGVYESGGRQSLFAVCTKYKQTDGIKILPQGKYLCADCAEENRAQVTDELVRAAKENYGAHPRFTVQMIVLSGILQWNYQVQVFLERFA